MLKTPFSTVFLTTTLTIHKLEMLGMLSEALQALKFPFELAKKAKEIFSIRSKRRAAKTRPFATAVYDRPVPEK